MPTHGSEGRNGHGLGTAAKEVVDHASAIAKLELELAALELKRKIGTLAAGIGLGATAAVLGFFAVAFVLAAAGAGLALVMRTWLALLAMAGLLIALTGVLAMLALGAIRRATPPLPEQAIREAKLTTRALKR
jgi:hypothetical protein